MPDETDKKYAEYLLKLPGYVDANPALYLGRIGIKPRYFKESLDTFKGGERIVKAAKVYIEAPKESLLCMGICGSGKTHIASSICRELVKKDVTSIKSISVPNLLLKLRSIFGKKSDDTEADVIDRYSEVDFLVLDDMGAEKTSDYSITSLYLIFDNRINSEKPTIVTTNLDFMQIEEVFGSRISSRLSEFKVWKFALADYRKKR